MSHHCQCCLFPLLPEIVYWLASHVAENMCLSLCVVTKDAAKRMRGEKETLGCEGCCVVIIVQECWSLVGVFRIIPNALLFNFVPVCIYSNKGALIFKCILYIPPREIPLMKRSLLTGFCPTTIESRQPFTTLLYLCLHSILTL